jgi:hypothetical protein
MVELYLHSLICLYDVVFNETREKFTLHLAKLDTCNVLVCYVFRMSKGKVVPVLN